MCHNNEYSLPSLAGTQSIALIVERHADPQHEVDEHTAEGRAHGEYQVNDAHYRRVPPEIVADAAEHAGYPAVGG